jgi:hypothetical protein
MHLSSENKIKPSHGPRRTFFSQNVIGGDRCVGLLFCDNPKRTHIMFSWASFFQRLRDPCHVFREPFFSQNGLEDICMRDSPAVFCNKYDPHAYVLGSVLLLNRIHIRTCLSGTVFFQNHHAEADVRDFAALVYNNLQTSHPYSSCSREFLSSKTEEDTRMFLKLFFD